MERSRKTETRSKIQLGGLLIKSGMVSKLGIDLTRDLELNDGNREKAYTLLGILKDAAEKLNTDEMTYYSSKGRHRMSLG